MTPRALAAVGALALCGVLSARTHATQISIIDEPFSGSTVPDGWIFNGRNSASHIDPSAGSAKTEAEWFGGGQGFVRLTSRSPGFQRTTAIYTGRTFSTLVDFSIAAEVNISSPGGTNGADGLSFFWLDATSLDLVTYDLRHYQGGVGEWQGTPRGTVIGTKTPGATTSHFGAYNSTDGFYANRTGESLRGYSFEFDHYQNASQEQLEYNHMVRLDDWAHMDNMNVNSSGDDTYYEDVGWVSFQLDYSAGERSFTYTYTGRDPNSGDPVAARTVELTPTDEEWTGFGSVYFGIGAGTGGQLADHDVRNLIVTQAPGPGTLALLGCAPLALLAVRHRRRWPRVRATAAA
jgi:hypothetical protein